MINNPGIVMGAQENSVELQKLFISKMIPLLDESIVLFKKFGVKLEYEKLDNNKIKYDLGKCGLSNLINLELELKQQFSLRSEFDKSLLALIDENKAKLIQNV